MTQRFSNVETYLAIAFLFAILTAGVVYLGNEVLTNDNANLDNDSIEYIANLNGIDLDEYRASSSDIQNPIILSGNESEGTLRDEALAFLFAQEKSYDVEIAIKRVFGIPSFIIVDLLQFNVGDFEWIIDIMGWFISLSILIALVNYLRGVIR